MRTRFGPDLDELHRVLSDFVGADLRNAELAGVSLQGLRWSATTQWPPDWAERMVRDSVEVEPGIFEVRSTTHAATTVLIPPSTGGAVAANLTLVVDEDMLRRARVRAMQQGRSVNALLREYLARIAGESEARRGMDEFFASVTGAGGGSGGRSWTRDELYDRT